MWSFLIKKECILSVPKSAKSRNPTRNFFKAIFARNSLIVLEPKS